MTKAEAIRCATRIHADAWELAKALRAWQRLNSRGVRDEMVDFSRIDACLTSIQREAGRVRSGVVTPNTKMEQK